MTRYSTEPRDHIFLKEYGLLLDAVKTTLNRATQKNSKSN